MPTIFLDGSFQTLDDAKVSALDAGFQHGMGLFETMLATGTKATPNVVHLHEHLARLAHSARTLGLSDTIRTAPLAEAVERVASQGFEDHPGVQALRIRLTITGGDLSLLAGAPGRPKDADQRAYTPTVLIVAQPAVPYPPEFFEKGVLVTLADWRVNPLDAYQGHKTLWYWPRLRELQTAAAKRAGEALVLSVTNHVAGGCVSNLFVVKHGTLITPIARGEEEDAAIDAEERRADHPTHTNPLSTESTVSPASPRGGNKNPVLASPILPGIVRAWALGEAKSKDLPIERRMVTISDVLDGDEVFLTNSSWGVLPVVQVEGRPIGDGTPGPTTRSFVQEWRRLIVP